jgi:hypothetical protein
VRHSTAFGIIRTHLGTDVRRFCHTHGVGRSSLLPPRGAVDTSPLPLFPCSGTYRCIDGFGTASTIVLSPGGNLCLLHPYGQGAPISDQYLVLQPSGAVTMAFDSGTVAAFWWGTANTFYVGTDASTPFGTQTCTLQ